VRIVDFTESMFGMPAPGLVVPLDPSAAIVKCVCGLSRWSRAEAGEAAC
jgi:hypothetical protein